MDDRIRSGLAATTAGLRVRLSGLRDLPEAAAFPRQLRILGALMMREAMSRFGRENIGFFWLIGEPLLLTLGVMVMWSMTKHGNSHGASIGIAAMALTGYSMLTLWRHCTTRAVHAFRSNAGLLFHRNIYFIDIVIARVLLEMVAIGAAFMVGYVAIFLMGYMDPIHDPLTLVGSWLLMGWFCFGLALTIAAATEMVEPLEHFVQPVMYIMMPITGAFFMVEWLPLQLQKVVLFSPLVHLNEMFRHGLYGNQIATHWSVPYVLLWCLPLTAIGFFLCEAARSRIRFE